MRWEDKMLCCGLYGLCHIYSATISVLIGLILANKKDPGSKLLNFFNLKEIKIKTKAVPILIKQIVSFSLVPIINETS